MAAKTATGTLNSWVSSTASSPTVKYAAAYEADGKSVTVTFAAQLGSSGSKLGTGIRLTVFARVKGGTWYSATLKEPSASWSGTVKHAARLTLRAANARRVTVEWYVSRAGSSYGGTAGTLGSASSPMKGYASMPETASDADGTPTGGGLYVKTDGVWRRAVAYVKSGGTWRQTRLYGRIGGAWRAADEGR